MCTNCAVGTALQWSLTGTLPPGLGFSAQGPTATVSGTPTTPGSFPVTVQVTDAEKSSGTASFTINITGSVTITTSVILPSGVVGQNYNLQLGASGGAGPYKWVLPVGAAPNELPRGMSLSTAGVISGAPTLAGNYGFDVTATDTQGAAATAHFEVTIAPAMTILTASPLVTGTVNSAYSQPISVTGGTPPYTFSIVDPGNAPPGIVIAANGVLGGVPKANGNYTFSIQATDKNQYSVSKQFQLSIAPSGPLLQTSVRSLTFSANVGGDAPEAQGVAVTVPSGVPVNFAVTVDSGVPATNGVPPGWITVTPTGGPAPAGIVVSVNQNALQPGKYTAVIHVIVPGNTSQTPIDIAVTFNVAAGNTQLLPLPGSLRFAARAVSASAQDQIIVLSNPGGGGALSFSTSVVGKSSWITAVNPTTGRIAPNSPASIRVFVNTQGQKVGLYHDIVRVTSTAGTVDFPVTLFVSDPGPVLGLSSRGLRFQMRQGAGSSQTQSVNVLDLGDPATSSAWQAELITGSAFLSIAPVNGVSTPSRPAALSVTPTAGANTLSPGGHYALIRVTDPNAINSPQYLVVVLDVAAASSLPLPDPSPAGLFFVSGGPAQTFTVFTSSTDPVPFQTDAYTGDGNPWLSATPAFGTASTSTPGKVSVSITPGSLPPGIYYGSVNVSMNGALRTVNVTLVVTTVASAQLPSAASSSAAATCAPSKLAITQTGLVNNFSVPAGWPATLIAQVNDDCGSAVPNASVVANFSNGDAPVSLRGDSSSNIYSATWQPGAVLPSMTITVRATSATLAQAVQQYAGAVNQNSSAPPALVPNGALHIFFNSTMAATLGSGLAPGNVAQVYGTALAPAASQTTVPLPDNFGGTFMLIGSTQVPLFYVSDQLLNVEVPAELTPNKPYSLIVSSNGALSLPESIDVTPLQPGVAQFQDGTVIAQISGTTTLITASNPAKPGQALTIYLAGMGATTPAVQSGKPTPLQLVPANVQPKVTLDGQDVTYAYAGLTPTGIGLYQINLTVPMNARAGNLDLVVSQNGVPANVTKLPVSN